MACTVCFPGDGYHPWLCVLVLLSLYELLLSTSLDIDALFKITINIIRIHTPRTMKHRSRPISNIDVLRSRINCQLLALKSFVFVLPLHIQKGSQKPSYNPSAALCVFKKRSIVAAIPRSTDVRGSIGQGIVCRMWDGLPITTSSPPDPKLNYCLFLPHYSRWSLHKLSASQVFLLGISA